MTSSILWAAVGTGFTFFMTSLGAAMVFFFRKSVSPGIQRIFLGFAAGVMIAASVWSLLIPAMEEAEAAGQSGLLPAVGGFLLGVVFLILLDSLLPHLHAGSSQPEGLKSSWKRTTLLVFAVTLHNIPEGMAVALQLTEGGMKKTAAVLLTALAGAPTVAGAAFGFMLGNINPLWLSLSLSAASGAMLYVVFGELPASVNGSASGLPAFAVLAGILTGILMTVF